MKMRLVHDFLLTLSWRKNNEINPWICAKSRPFKDFRGLLDSCEFLINFKRNFINTAFSEFEGLMSHTGSLFYRQIDQGAF